MATGQQKNRLKVLVKFLEEELNPKKFNLGHWVGIRDATFKANPHKMAENPSEVGTCGTTACVVGWFPYLFPLMAEWEVEGARYLYLIPPADNTWLVKPICGIDKNIYGSNEDLLFQEVTGLSRAATLKII